MTDAPPFLLEPLTPPGVEDPRRAINKRLKAVLKIRGLTIERAIVLANIERYLPYGAGLGLPADHPHLWQLACYLGVSYLWISGLSSAKITDPNEEAPLVGRLTKIAQEKSMALDVFMRAVAKSPGGREIDKSQQIKSVLDHVQRKNTLPPGWLSAIGAFVSHSPTWVVRGTPEITKANRRARKSASATRPKTENLLRGKHLPIYQDVEDTTDLPERPENRAECLNGPRPCPWVGCRHHLYLEVDGGTIKYMFPDHDVSEMAHSCSLDYADDGGSSMDEVAIALNLTRERVRQVECVALAAFSDAAPHLAEYVEKHVVHPQMTGG